MSASAAAAAAAAAPGAAPAAQHSVSGWKWLLYETIGELVAVTNVENPDGRPSGGLTIW